MKRIWEAKPVIRLRAWRELALVAALVCALAETNAHGEAGAPTELQQKFGLASILSEAAPSLADRIHPRAESAKAIDTGSGYPNYRARGNDAYWRPGFRPAPALPPGPSAASPHPELAGVTSPPPPPASGPAAATISLSVESPHVPAVPVKPESAGEALAREADEMEANFNRQQALATLQAAKAPSPLGTPLAAPKVSPSDRLLASLQSPQQESKYGELARQQAQNVADFTAVRAEQPVGTDPMYVTASRGEVEQSEQIAQAFRARSVEVAPALPIYPVYDSSTGAAGQMHAKPSGNSQDDAPGGVYHLTSSRTTTSGPSTSSFSNYTPQQQHK